MHELIEKMQKAGLKTQWGDDLYPKNLKKIGLKDFTLLLIGLWVQNHSMLK